jgi:hypothetical protein
MPHWTADSTEDYASSISMDFCAQIENFIEAGNLNHCQTYSFDKDSSVHCHLN